jgi:hypothetical protein
MNEGLKGFLLLRFGIADCGIVMIQTRQELMRGLFGKEMDVWMTYTKNLNKVTIVLKWLFERKLIIEQILTLGASAEEDEDRDQKEEG